MEITQHLAFITNLNVLTLSESLILWLPTVVIPPTLMVTGVYWAIREHNKKSNSTRNTRILGLALLTVGLVLFILARNYDSNQFVLYTVGPVAIAAGITHWKLKKSMTNSGIITTGLGVGTVIILIIHAISNM